MAITASAVQELRKITNAGMMSCKKALTETNGDMDEAVKLLREKGEAKRNDRADRETSEGITSAFVSSCGSTGLLIAVNCETDFVAKNDDFQSFVSEITQAVAEGGATDIDSALAVSFGESNVEKTFGAKFAELGEVIKISELARFSNENAAVTSYIHMGGKVGVLVELGITNQATKENPAFQELISDLTLHIAAMAPQALNREGIDGSAIETENEINRKQLEAEGKPAQIIENILKGKINKFYSETVLLEQKFVKDDSVNITALLEAKSKEVGDTITLNQYARFTVGA